MKAGYNAENEDIDEDTDSDSDIEEETLVTEFRLQNKLYYMIQNVILN